METSIKQARRVKEQLNARIGRAPCVTGIGLTRTSGGWAVKVNLRQTSPELNIPSQIDGVRIVQDVVGNIVAR